MSASFDIAAQPRRDEGKGASRRLRRQGQVPGIVYGGGEPPQMILVKHDELIHQLSNEAFYSHVLALTLDGKTQQVVLRDLQRHPAKPFVQHVDFQRVTATEELRMLVPIHFTGEAAAPGIKHGGMLARHVTELEVTCLPKDLPEYVDVDVSSLDIGDGLTLSQLALPAGVELTALAQEDAPDELVVSIEHQVEHKVEAEVEGEGEGEIEEGPEPED